MKKRVDNTIRPPRHAKEPQDRGTAAEDQCYYSLYCYLWDALDHGLDSFARLAQSLGLTHISVAASYHGGKALLPHNSGQHVYFIEDGAVYFRPAARFFSGTRMRPLVSRLVRKRDVFRDLVEKCLARGVKTTAWTVALHNTYLGTSYPEFASENAFGNRYLHALCPSQSQVIAYLRSLARNLAAYDIDAVEFETFEHIPFRHYGFLEKEGIAVTPMACLLLSLCFCSACRAKAKNRAIAVRPLQKAVTRWLQEYFAGKNRSVAPVEEQAQNLSGLDDYLQMRFDVLTDAFQQISGLLHEHGKRVIFLSIGQERDRDYLTGVDLRQIAQHADAIETLFYARRSEDAAPFMKSMQKAMAMDRKISFAIRPGYPDAASAADVATLTRSVVRAGAAGVSYYNFGLLESYRMPWIREAIREVQKRSFGSTETAGEGSGRPVKTAGFVRPNVLRNAY